MKTSVARVTIAALIFALVTGCSTHPKIIKSYQFAASGTGSVLSQSASHFHLEYDSSSAGVFVKAINGSAQPGSAYWIYFVNGASGQEACDKFIPAAGDTIEWRLIAAH